MKTVSYDDMLTSFSYKSLLAVLLASMTTLSQAEQPQSLPMQQLGEKKASNSANEGGPLPSSEQLDKITAGDFAELARYLGEKNPVAMVCVYKIEIAPNVQSEGRLMDVRYHGLIVQSNAKEIPVGRAVRWRALSEVEKACRVTSIQGGELYYVVHPSVEKLDVMSGEMVLNWKIDRHFKITNGARVSSLRASFRIPESNDAEK